MPIRTLEVTAPDGAQTGARCAGDAGPALIFVHGVGSTAAIWDAQLDALESEYRCCAVELRGNGALRDPDPALISREGFAKDVLAVASAAGIEDFTLVGCSLGGVVAFELYRTVPERFDAAVIAGSFAAYPSGQAYADGVIAAVREAGDMATFAKIRAAKLSMPPDRERVTIEQMACKSVPSYVASTQATWTGDYRDLLPKIGVPVLVVCGERDVVAPYALSQEIAMGIPGARVEVIENAGHVCNADAPAAFNALLAEFLGAVRAA